MEDISVLFHDGQSSAGRKAILKLFPGFLHIEYDGMLSEKAITKWDVTAISKAERQGELLTLRYGRFPEQIIQGNTNELESAIRLNYPLLRLFEPDPLSLKGWVTLSAAAIFLLALLASLYFYVLPPFAGFMAEQIPKSVEESLGKSMLNSFLRNSEINHNLSRKVNTFAKEINFNTDYDIHITVVKSTDVNAFALPGGSIVIFDGILKKMNSPEELAALLAHEVAHIEYKHSLNSISRSLSRYLLISLILNDINGISSILIDNANTLNNLSYSRTLESDADNRALQTLKSNKISQYGMVNLFKAFESSEELSYLKFLSTHPLTTERVRNAREQASRQGQVATNVDLKALWKDIKGDLF